MSTIRVPVYAYILDLYPLAMTGTTLPAGEQGIQSLANGLALPSFWTRTDIDSAFAEANRIWLREADISFSPVTVSCRSMTVAADARSMYIAFINQLAPPLRSAGVGVGFVYDLPENEGGWGGGRMAVLSGEKAAEGIAGFGGNLLAHELGHILIIDHDHSLASNDSNNLMYGARNPRVANPGVLNEEQRSQARERAEQLSRGS